MSYSNRTSSSTPFLAALLVCGCASTESGADPASFRAADTAEPASSESAGSSTGDTGSHESSTGEMSMNSSSFALDPVEYIGWTTADLCPKPLGWSAELIFAVGDETWCKYEPDTGSGEDANPSDLHEVLEDVSQDFLGVFPQTSLSDLTAPLLHTSFKERIGDVEAAQLLFPGGGSSEAFREEVVVSVIDTTSEWQVDASQVNSMHGAHMGRIVDDIACPTPEECAVTIASFIGLPRTPQGPDYEIGGFVGTHGDFAAAIYASVDAWENIPDAPRLIINLSAGWESAIVGTRPDGSEPARVQAVRSALEYASCQGALIIAAVGNTSHHCQEGPLAPALWEGQEAPTDQRCGDLGLTTANDGLGLRPLVYGVSGLNGQNAPMPGTREDSNARLAAPATHVVAGNDAYTTSLTGTSVAAAAASGTAALVWSYNPNMTADEVMGVLYQSGHDLNATADTYPGTPQAAPGVKRINACSALDYACSLNANCTLQLGCVDADGDQPLTAATQIVADAPVLDPQEVGPLPAPEVCPVACTPRTARGESSTVCDDTDSDPLEAFITPQPNDPACPECTLDDDVLTGDLDPVYDGHSIDSVVLRLYKDGRHRDIDVTGRFNLNAQTSSRLTIDGIDLSALEGAAVRVQFSAYPNYIENKIRYQ